MRFDRTEKPSYLASKDNGGVYHSARPAIAFRLPKMSRPDVADHRKLRHREEPDDLVNNTSALVRLEKKLSVCGTFQNDKFFWFRSSFVLGTDARKPQASRVGVFTRNNE